MNRRVYLGNLSNEAREDDIRDLFGKYGRINRVDLKQGYGFIEYDDPRAASDSIHELDGYRLFNEKMRVEYSKGPKTQRVGDRGGDRGDRSYSSSSTRPRYEERGRAHYRSNYRLIVENLSDSVSWQDLKDHMRKAGDVVFTDILKDQNSRPRGRGIVEFRTFDDMKHAIKELDDTNLAGKYILLKEDRDGRYDDYGKGRDQSGRVANRHYRGRSRSRSPGYKKRSRDRSESPRDRGDRSDRDRSRSPRRRRSRSPIRSRSRSPQDRPLSPRGNSNNNNNNDGGQPIRSRSRSKSPPFAPYNQEPHINNPGSN